MLFEYPTPNGPLCLFLTCAALPIAALVRQLNPRLAGTPMPEDWSSVKVAAVAVGLAALVVVVALAGGPLELFAAPLMAIASTGSAWVDLAAAGGAVLVRAGATAWHLSVWATPVLLALAWVTEVRWPMRALAWLARVSAWPVAGVAWVWLLDGGSPAEDLALIPLLWTVPLQIAWITSSRRLAGQRERLLAWRAGLEPIAVSSDEAPKTRMTRLPSHIATHLAAEWAPAPRPEPLLEPLEGEPIAPTLAVPMQAMAQHIAATRADSAQEPGWIDW